MSELERIRHHYAEREGIGEELRYSPIRPGNLLNIHERERAFVAGLARHGMKRLSDIDVLEVGCGTGGELARLIVLGVDPDRLHGIDLRDEAVDIARSRVPVDIRVGDASSLPWGDGSFDLVLQLTALSSMLDPHMRTRVGAEMVRVLRPDGLIVSYDFHVNPRNRQTVGISADELRRIFPELTFDLRRVTLAPPLARQVGDRSRHLAAVLAALPPLRTHLMAFGWRRPM